MSPLKKYDLQANLLDYYKVYTVYYLWFETQLLTKFTGHHGYTISGTFA